MCVLKRGRKARARVVAPGGGFFCIQCVRDPVIVERVEDSGVSRKCSYCGRRGKTLPLEEILDEVDEAYRRYYTPGPEVPVIGDGDHTSFESEGDEPSAALQELVDCEPSVADELVLLLGDRENFDVQRDGATAWYDSGTGYVFKEPVGADAYIRLWEHFADEIEHRGRYFSSKGTKLLRDLLAGLGSYALHDGSSPIVTLGPSDGTVKVFRARVARSRADCIRILKQPEIELAAPPCHLVSSGRMNPAGIPVFYGAFDRDTAVAEVRAPIGSLVVVAAFQVIRPVRVLDLTRLANATRDASVLREDFDDQFARRKFLNAIDSLIGQPVQPHEEHIQYVRTQMFFEYLASVHRPRIDGLVYSSAQRGPGGRNVALYPHASVVRRSKSSASSGGVADEPDLVLMEDVAWLSQRAPATPGATPKRLSRLDRLIAKYSRFRVEQHRPRLALCANELRVCTVRSVSYDVVARRVAASTSPGSDDDF